MNGNAKPHSESTTADFIVPANVNNSSWSFVGPERWQRNRLRMLCDINPAPSGVVWGDGQAEVSFLPMELAGTNNPRFKTVAKPLAEVLKGFSSFRDGDVLVAKITPCFENGKGGICSGLLNRVGCGSTEFHVLRPKADIDARFLYYVTISQPFREVGAKMMRGSAGQQRVPTEFLSNFVILYPNLNEQHAIARFLDHNRRLTDRFIAAKRRLVKLLNEQKQAIIHRAVTRGLNPDAHLRPSGIDWLGEVPEHWEVAPLRRNWQVVDCKHITVPFFDEGIPLASVVEVQRFDLDLSRAKRTTPEYYQMLIEGGRQPQRGDIIYCRNSSVGAAAFVDTEEQLAMGQDVCLIRSSVHNGRFLNYQLNALFIRQQLNRLLVGATIRRINVGDVRSLATIVPPRNEQDSIVQYLDVEMGRVNKAIQRVENQMQLVKEYRSRLIADVVTGKLDVRNVVLPVDDTDEAEAWDEPEDTEDMPDPEEDAADADQ